jgi:ABC-type sugar transport system substrate-binding protein
MCAALVGGMDRLRNEYIEAAKGMGVDLKVFTGQERSIKNQLGDLDMMILFTGKVSHAARVEAIKHAKAKRIPLHMIHSSGVSALRKCIGDQC